MTLIRLYPRSAAWVATMMCVTYWLTAHGIAR